jgi:hypothetical protein
MFNLSSHSVEKRLAYEPRVSLSGSARKFLQALYHKLRINRPADNARRGKKQE